MTHLLSARVSRHFAGASTLALALLVPATLYTTPAIAQTQRDPVLRPNASARQVQQILARIRTDANALRTAVDETTPRGRAAGNARAAENQEALYLIDDVLQDADRLNDRAARSSVNQSDVDAFLRHAAELDSAMSTGQFRPVARTAWTRLRGTIDELASTYNVAWDWRSPRYASDAWANDYRRFAGSYRLSTADSDDPRAIAQNALRRVAAADRARVSRQLENRLTPPDAISIERDATRVTIASTTGQQTTFEADGREQRETGPAGRTMTTRASLNGDELEISTVGSGGSDFSVTFEPLDGGNTLHVTRRLYSDALQVPVVVDSVYRRVSETPNWNIYEADRARPRTGTTANRGRTIPSGTTVVATLDQPLNLRSAREGDRLTLRVTNGPAEFRNATIEGYVTSEPTRASAQQGVSLAFDTVRLANGRVGDFSGTIDSVRDSQGRTIEVEGVESSGNVDKDEAIQRGAIGAAIGAILGGVIGGGKGAAVGAVLGAGGGAGTVLLGDQAQQTLPRGTEFTIRTDTIDVP